MQYLLDASAASALLLIVGSAVWLVYRTSGYFDFGLLLTQVASPYVLLALTKSGGNLVSCLALCIAATAVTGSLIGLAVAALPPGRGHRLVLMTVGSYGLWLAGQGALLAWFGDQPQPFPWPLPSQPWRLAGLDVPLGALLQLAGAGAATILLLSFHLGPYWVAWKASATNGRAAIYYALPQRRIGIGVYAAGYVFAALAGLVQAVSIDVTPYPDFSLFLNGATVALLAQGFRQRTVAFYSLAIGGGIYMSTIAFGSVWQEAISAAILLASLLAVTYTQRGNG